MKRLIFTLIAISLVGFHSNAQDTTVVQTLKFSDITKRKGTWDFPSDGSYEKVLMYYTLKCDPQTTRDNFDCGEWDYLSYTTVFDSTGEFDTVVMQHSNFMVGDLSPAALELTSAAPMNKFERTYLTPQYSSLTPMDSAMLGIPNSRIYDANGAKRYQFMFTAAELSAAGLNPGMINALEIFSDTLTASDHEFTVFIQSTSASSINGISELGSEPNYINTTQFVPGSNKLQLARPFNWDGSSNVIIEFRSKNGVLNYPLMGEISGTQTHYENHTGKQYFEFTENNYIEIDPSYLTGNGYDSLITISFWMNGGEQLPVNTSILEARNSDDQRVLNIHMPWSNSSVYWDAGIPSSGTGYDRLQKAANSSNFQGRWNHWTFTKNTSTGDMKIFLNGQQWAASSGNTGSMSGITKIKLGESFSGNQWYGKLDQFRVWSRELNATQIQSVMVSEELSPAQKDGLTIDLNFENKKKLSSEAHLLNMVGQDPIIVHGRVNIEEFDETNQVYSSSATDLRPAIQFHQALRNDTNIAENTTTIEKLSSPISISLFKDSGDPLKRTGFKLAFSADSTFLLSESGDTVEKYDVTPTETLTREWNYYEVYNEIINTVEIGRFITPYGIGLDLGPDGFRWIYDVTDYVGLLRDRVTLSAGNQQELIDLKFLFIEGTPGREVIKIHNLANRVSRQYGVIADDTYFKADTVELTGDASHYKLITRITGHGHNGNSGNGQIHCCEWADKEHNLMINGTDQIKWDIWQNDKCALNPVMDQGGNWAPPRAGWCPGAPVDDYSFDLTDFIGEDDQVVIDYGIEPVPPSNPGQAGGNYVISFHLIEYGEFNHQHDAAVEQIITPTNWEFYKRINPSCTRPVIRIINRGAETLTSADIVYGVEGGNPIKFFWQGELDYMEAEDIELPFAIWDWVNDDNNMIFFAEIQNPNGKADENPSNDRLVSAYEAPDVFGTSVEILYRNNRIEDADVVITDDQGEVVYENLNQSGTALSRETIALNPGCYKMVVTTEEGFGLSYPLIPQIGTGLLRLIDKSTNQGPLFVSDFGKSFTYHFMAGYGLSTKNVNPIEESLSVYPNPTDGLVTVELKQEKASEVTIEVLNAHGQVVRSFTENSAYILNQIDLSEQSAGVYFISVTSAEGTTERKVVLQ